MQRRFQDDFSPRFLISTIALFDLSNRVSALESDVENLQSQVSALGMTTTTLGG